MVGTCRPATARRDLAGVEFVRSLDRVQQAAPPEEIFGLGSVLFG